MSATARQIARIHATAKKAGLDEDTRRDLMERETGKRSARDLTAAEAWRVIDRLAAVAGSSSAVSSAPKIDHMDTRYGGLLRALWIAGYNLGVVRSPKDAALVAFVERQTGLAHPRFLLEDRHARAAVEGLKAWLAREAGWTPLTQAEQVRAAAALGVDEIRAAKIHLLRRQWELYQALSDDPVTGRMAEVALFAYAGVVLGHPSRTTIAWADPRLTPEALDRVSAAIGKAIRKGGPRG